VVFQDGLKKQGVEDIQPPSIVRIRFAASVSILSWTASDLPETSISAASSTKLESVVFIIAG
jgi:hypothetical protein